MRMWDYEQAYRRRLMIITPIAAVAMTVLFLTSEHIPFREFERQVGWKGEMHLLPEITVLPDQDATTSKDRDSDVEAMTSLDITLTDAPGENSTHSRSDEAEEDKLPDIPKWSDFDVRTVEMHRDVPYSQDYVILKMVEPEYPPEELKQGIEGNVTVELLVDEHGHVAKATVLSRAGPRSFEDSSLDAVRQFVFQPPIENGRPSTMWVKFQIKFRIFG